MLKLLCNRKCDACFLLDEIGGKKTRHLLLVYKLLATVIEYHQLKSGHIPLINAYIILSSLAHQNTAVFCDATYRANSFQSHFLMSEIKLTICEFQTAIISTHHIV